MEGNLVSRGIVVDNFWFFLRQAQFMVFKKYPGDIHECLNTLLGPTDEDNIISKENWTNIDGPKIYAQTRWMKIMTKIIDEQAKQQGRKIAT